MKSTKSPTSTIASQTSRESMSRTLRDGWRYITSGRRRHNSNSSNPTTEPRPPIIRHEHTPDRPIRIPIELDLEGPVPKVVPLKFIVFLNDRRFDHFEEARLYWNDPCQFHDFEKVALRILEERGNVKPEDESTRLYKRAGRCRVVRREDNFEVDSQILEDEKQWAQVLPLMVAKFTSTNKYVKFFLEIRWEYSLLIIRKIPGQLYSKTIQEVLYDNMTDNFRGQQFIPRKVLRNVFEKSTISELVKTDTSLDRLAQIFDNDAYGTIDKDKFIEDVVSFGVLWLALCVYSGLPLSCLWRLLQDNRDSTKLLTRGDRPQGANGPRFEHLVALQGCFNAHNFFNTGIPTHLGLADNIVVPVMFNEKNDRIGGGGFGEVFRVQIHPDHHLFSSNRNAVFALKRFYDKQLTATYFQQEARALEALYKVPHPNITLHLASWTQDGRFYMLFPHAESNLKQYIRSQPAPELKKEFVIWILGQMRDLAAAVQHIHSTQRCLDVEKVPHKLGPPAASRQRRYSHVGFHYDLKPDNILVFAGDKKTGPTLKISDFGLAQIHEIVTSGSRQPVGSVTAKDGQDGDPEYQAPDRAYEGKSGRAYDIWSLGCIYLEMLLWTIGYGGSQLENFYFDRLRTSQPTKNQTAAFWYINQQGRIRLKSAVIERLLELQSSCENRGVFRDLVSLVSEMLTIIPRQRPRAPDVWAAISALIIQAETDLQNPDFYLNVVQDRQVVAKPVTAVHSPSRAHSIDMRSVTPSPTTPERPSLSPNDANERRRSFSEPLRIVPSLALTDSEDLEFAGSHLDPTYQQNTRSRSPSISIVNPQGEAHEHQDSDVENRPLFAHRVTVNSQNLG